MACGNSSKEEKTNKTTILRPPELQDFAVIYKNQLIILMTELNHHQKVTNKSAQRVPVRNHFCEVVSIVKIIRLLVLNVLKVKGANCACTQQAVFRTTSSAQIHLEMQYLSCQKDDLCMNQKNMFSLLSILAGLLI